MLILNLYIFYGGSYTCVSFDATKGSRPYPSYNAKHQINVMFLTHPPTYDNVKRCSLHLEKVYMPLQHNVKGLLFKPIHPSITLIWRFAWVWMALQSRYYNFNFCVIRFSTLNKNRLQLSKSNHLHVFNEISSWSRFSMKSLWFFKI